jgi:hypothetical protein
MTKTPKYVKPEKLSEQQWDDVVDQAYLLYNSAIPREELRVEIENKAAEAPGWVESLHEFFFNPAGRKISW